MSVLGIKNLGSSTPEVVATLTNQDLCDRCPAAGSAVVLLPLKRGEKIDVSLPQKGRVLVFCTHHLNVHAPKLAELGFKIYKKGDN
jgi:hypothetical protein